MRRSLRMEAALSLRVTAATSARSCGYAGSQHNMPDFPLIGLVWHRNGQQPAEQWHTDHTNRERPPAATILYGVEIPSAGGGTSVANMRAKLNYVTPTGAPTDSWV